jgi:hypothetical protein
VPVRLLNDHAFVNAQQGYLDDAGELDGYHPGRAARLLDRAGWRPAGRFRRKDGTPLALRYVYPLSAAASRRNGELIQIMLGRVGVRLDLRPVPDSDFFDRYLIPGAFDIAPFSWIGGPFPISGMRSIYGRPRGGDPQQNVARVGSARLDALLDRATGELDTARARQYANEADRMNLGRGALGAVVPASADRSRPAEPRELGSLRPFHAGMDRRRLPALIIYQKLGEPYGPFPPSTASSAVTFSGVFRSASSAACTMLISAHLSCLR